MAEDWQRHALDVSAPDARMLVWESDPGDTRLPSYRVTVALGGPMETILVKVLPADRGELLWVPFLTLDTRPYSNDETFLRMFPGAMADRLRLLGDRFARGLPLDPWQVALTVLTGEPPEVPAIRVTTLAPAIRTSAKTGVRAEQALATRLAAGASACGNLQIEAVPYVSATTVRHYYSYYQKSLTAQPMGDRAAGLPPTGRAGTAYRCWVCTVGSSEQNTHTRVSRLTTRTAETGAQ